MRYSETRYCKDTIDWPSWYDPKTQSVKFIICGRGPIHGDQLLFRNKELIGRVYSIEDWEATTKSSNGHIVRKNELLCMATIDSKEVFDEVVKDGAHTGKFAPLFATTGNLVALLGFEITKKVKK